MAIDAANSAEVRGQTAHMTPILWAEGLASPARLALERARGRGVPSAAAALADIEERGGQSAVARAIVRRLAAQQAERAKGDLLKMSFEPWPPPGFR